jgi:O-methyltransferase
MCTLRSLVEGESSYILSPSPTPPPPSPPAGNTSNTTAPAEQRKLERMAEQQGQNQGKVTTIEIDTESSNVARKNIEDAALVDKVEVIEGDALDVIPKLNEKFEWCSWMVLKRNTLSILS